MNWKPPISNFDRFAIFMIKVWMVFAFLLAFKLLMWLLG